METNKEKGANGEAMASQYLINNGFQILERNWRHHHLEVDIIASRNELLHIVEVKTRHSHKFGLPEESISKHKMGFLKNAAEAYQFQNPTWKKIQFDVIAISIHPNSPHEIFMIEDVYF